MLNIPITTAFQLWESAINAAKNGITIVDAQAEDMPIIYANPAFEQQTGYSSSEIIGKNPRFLHGNDIDQPALVEIKQALAEQKYCNVVIRNYQKDGTPFWNELFISPIFDAEGNLTHFIGIQNYITERKLAEEEILTLNRQLEERVIERTVQLEETNRVLALEIARREQLEVELRNSLEKEQELGKLKSRFISIASHEFRSPLTVLVLYSELLESEGEDWTQEKRVEISSSIKETVLHLTEILDDVLAVSKGEAGGLQFSPRPHNIANTCIMALSEISSSHHTNKLHFVNRFEPEFVMVDEKLLRSILVNLLSNAIKYSQGGNPVYLSLSSQEDKIIIEVSDYGRGIPEKDQHRIFEAFYRASNVAGISGTGLGLAIVKNSVELHGGEISFISRPGEGTTFTVTLPLRLYKSDDFKILKDRQYTTF